ERLGFEHTRVEHARATQAGRALVAHGAALSVQRAQHALVEIAQRRSATDQRWSCQIGLGYAQRLVMLCSGDGLEPAHHLERVLWTLGGVDAHQRCAQRVERRWNVGCELRGWPRLVAPSFAQISQLARREGWLPSECVVERGAERK